MIEVRGITKQYGAITALDDVSFHVNEGEIVGFLGPNGAGKSTMMRILTGFTPATRGTAKIADLYVEDDPVAVKRRVGYVPENVPLYPEMLVQRYLGYVATVKGVPRAQRNAETERVMSLCGLGEMGRRVIQNLSKGFRQRVGLAQALIGDPPVLILDEPTVGLDPNQIIEIRNTIRGLATDHTVLLSTHILPEVSMLCERVLIINRGRIVFEDTMENLSGAAADGEWVIELDRASAGFRQTANDVAGVSKVNSEGHTLTVFCETGTNPIPDMIQAVAAKGASIRRLSPRTRSLEEAFIQATAGDNAAREAV
jgi:ABC-type multidrug transport system ATPase subunit